MFESSAQCKDQCFHALPSLEPSEPNTPKLRSASQENFGELLSRECPKVCLRLTQLMELSPISLQVCHFHFQGLGAQGPAVINDAPKPARRTS